MKIIKENSYDIVRLYVNQLGIMIFSMLLYTAVGSFENEKLSFALTIFVSAFSLLFYMALVYYMMWEIGAKDKIRIDGGRMSPCRAKGLVMGIIANIPNFVLAALTLIFLIIYLLGGKNILSAFATSNLILRFHSSMYLGIITSIVPSSSGTSPDFIEYLIETILFLVLPIISIVTIHVSYYLGTKDKKIFSLRKKK